MAPGPPHPASDALYALSDWGKVDSGHEKDHGLNGNAHGYTRTEATA